MLLKHKESAEVRAEAAGAVYCLADGHENNKTSIASAGGIKPLISLLGSGLARAQEHAANALASLSFGNVENQVMTADGR